MLSSSPTQKATLNTDIPSTVSISTVPQELQTQSYYSSSASSEALADVPKNPNPALTSAAIFPDFNGDGKTDKIWRNSQNGQIAIWLMNGKQNPTGDFVKDGNGNNITMGQDWDLKIGDFNGDNKTDLLWHNNATGANQIWLMNGTQIASKADLPATNGWTPLIADFNGDRKTDILWRNTTTGENAIWQMNGTQISSADFLPKLDKNWTASIVDVNGDGKTDIFWRNFTTGENAVWQMDGKNISSGKFLPTLDSNWEATPGYFNRDLQTDILWYNRC
jgi:hypothetical protein